VNGGPCTLRKIEEIAGRYFHRKGAGALIIRWSAILPALGDASVDKPYWVLMLIEKLPESVGKSYAQQQALVINLMMNTVMVYKEPRVMEATIVALFQDFLGDACTIWTRCHEDIQDILGTFQVTVGGFDPTGLRIFNDQYDQAHIGMHPVCRIEEVPASGVF
jgi:hypothetical protein